MQFPTFFAKTATQIASKFLLQLVILKFCLIVFLAIYLLFSLKLFFCQICNKILLANQFCDRVQSFSNIIINC